MLPTYFNQVLRWMKKLINQTNQKRFFANRTRKNPANPPTKANQKWLVPIEYDLNKDTLQNKSGGVVAC